MSVCDGGSHDLHVRFSEHDRSSSFFVSGSKCDLSVISVGSYGEDVHTSEMFCDRMSASSDR